jgi:HlyD family secretion protein
MQATSRLIVLIGVLTVAFVAASSLARQSSVKIDVPPQAPQPPGNVAGNQPGQAVRCQVEKARLVLYLVPDGAVVKKGDLVCELDGTDLNDRLIDLTIAMKRAESERKIGQLSHEVALAAVKEYKEGTYLQDLGAIKHEIKRSESTLALASDRAEQITKMFRKGEKSQLEKVEADMALQESKFALQTAQYQLTILENLTGPNLIRRLVTEVEKASSQERAAQDILELERARAEKTRRQSENCRISAPRDGRVVLGRAAAGSTINEGDMVRERQLLFTVVAIPPQS